MNSTSNSINYASCTETYRTIQTSSVIQQALTTTQGLIQKIQNTVIQLFSKISLLKLTPLHPVISIVIPQAQILKKYSTS